MSLSIPYVDDDPIITQCEHNSLNKILIVITAHEKRIFSNTQYLFVHLFHWYLADSNDDREMQKSGSTIKTVWVQGEWLQGAGIKFRNTSKEIDLFEVLHIT